jgi:hypothetical protein
VQALLLTEEEYRNTLEGGGIPPPETENLKNCSRKVPMMGKATVGSTPPTQNRSEHNREKQKTTHEEQIMLHCQPTSSKIKVKNLVTDEQETREQASHINSRAVWDRPILKPQFEWPHDPRMPTKWNEMISAMQAYKRTRTVQTEETYHRAVHDEILEPKSFKDNWNPNPAIYDHLWKQSTARLKLGKQDTEFRELHSRFKKPKNATRKPNPQEVQHNLPINKGKRRAEETPPERDEHFHLRDRWHEEYADILDGTWNQLPPWREVNHEIHLIDESKRYTYHLPHCPSLL